MNDSIARAKFVDKLMTAVFYCVAGFFILLLVAFALYVIINGFKDFSWSLISFEGSGIGNLFFNTIYLVFLSLLVSVPLGVAAGIYMAEYAKQGSSPSSCVCVSKRCPHCRPLLSVCSVTWYLS